MCVCVGGGGAPPPSCILQKCVHVSLTCLQVQLLLAKNLSINFFIFCIRLVVQSSQNTLIESRKKKDSNLIGILSTDTTIRSKKSLHLLLYVLYQFGGTVFTKYFNRKWKEERL